MHTSLADRLVDIYRRGVMLLRSTRGRNIIAYLMCFCVAFCFWVLMSLDQEVQQDFDVPISLENCPDSVTLLGSLPKEISVTAVGKSSQLIRYQLSKPAPLKIKFEDYVTGPKVFAMSHIKIDGRLREYFGNSVQINSIRPDSIHVTYTTNPGVRLPLVVDADISPNLQCILSGPITASADSVLVYTNGDLPRGLTEIHTEPLVKTDLRDTLRTEVSVQPIQGARIIPNTVTVTIPIEPLIRKQRKIKVDAANVPEGYRMITFPAVIDVSYLVPISLYNSEFNFRAVIDYNDIVSGDVRLPIKLISMPGNYREAELESDSVEYVLERIR